MVLLIELYQWFADTAIASRAEKYALNLKDFVREEGLGSASGWATGRAKTEDV
ncbi:MAG: hypothetical protein ACM3NQ_20050 [Bacteroidales bacterium]